MNGHSLCSWGCDPRSSIAIGLGGCGALCGSAFCNRQSTIWHDHYSEHIIRSQPAFDRIREYIFANPLMWSYDPANPCRSGPLLADLEDLLRHDHLLS